MPFSLLIAAEVPLTRALLGLPALGAVSACEMPTGRQRCGGLGCGFGKC